MAVLLLIALVKSFDITFAMILNFIQILNTNICDKLKLNPKITNWFENHCFCLRNLYLSPSVH